MRFAGIHATISRAHVTRHHAARPLPSHGEGDLLVLDIYT